jgi:uncharacterized membrane protein
MSGVIRSVAPLVVLVAAAWLALLVAAPFLPAAAAALVYAFCSLICHQIADRSFHAGAVQLPVCARCLGIYAGFASVCVAAGFSRPIRGLTPRRILIAGALPTIVTVAAEWAGLWATSNVVRAIAGAPLGAAVALVVRAGLATLHYDECAPRPPIAPDRPPSPI